MAHVMRRERWRQLVLVSAAVWMLSFIPALLWARAGLAQSDAVTRHTALVVLAVLLTAGWIAVPLLIAGGDDTLDARRFATIGVNARAVMPGLVISAFLTLPAVFFIGVWFTLMSSWAGEGGAVLAVALIGAILEVATLVLTARLAAMWAGRLLAQRRPRAIAGAVGAMVAIGGAVLGWRVLRRGLTALLDEDISVAVDAFARTPIASAIGAATAAGNADWRGAAWRLGISAAWCALLALAWRANVAHALVHPLYRASGRRGRRDGIANGGSRAWALSRAARRGPAGAVHARLMRSWRTDPRYVTNLIAVVVMPSIFVVAFIPLFGLDQRWAFAAPFVLAASIGWGRHNDVAYDSSALWIDVVAGRRGAQVMRGRLSAVATWAVPVTVTAAIAVTLWVGQWGLLAGLIGATIGTLGATLGVAAVSSVVLPYRTPASGENPFAAEVGSVGAGLVAQLVSSVGTLLVMPVAIVPFVLAVVVDARWAMVSGTLGTAVGVVAFFGGATLAGKLYDARAGRLLAAVR